MEEAFATNCTDWSSPCRLSFFSFSPHFRFLCFVSFLIQTASSLRSFKEAEDQCRGSLTITIFFYSLHSFPPRLEVAFDTENEKREQRVKISIVSLSFPKTFLVVSLLATERTKYTRKERPTWEKKTHLDEVGCVLLRVLLLLGEPPALVGEGGIRFSWVNLSG